MDRMRVVTWMALAGVALASAAGCARRSEKPEGIGRQIVAGTLRNLVASPDGRSLAFLDHCVKPKVSGVMPEAALCDLQVVQSAGGAPRRVAQGVSTVGLNFMWNPHRETPGVAALAGYDFTQSFGSLAYAALDEGGALHVTSLGDQVTGFGFAPETGALGFIAAGQFSVRWPERPQPERIAGGESAVTFDVNARWRRGAGGANAGTAWMVRKSLAAGGELLAISEQGRVTRLALQSGDYGFDRTGGMLAYTARKGKGYDLFAASTERPAAVSSALGHDVQSHAFSNQGAALAFVADAAPGKLGNLYLNTVDNGKPVRLAEKIGSYRWAAKAPRLAWLQAFDPQIRSGVLATGGPDEKPEVVGRNVTDYDLTPDGSWVAFVEHVTTEGSSVSFDLKWARRGGTPEVVAHGVFSFSFSPDGKYLYYRNKCTGSDVCDLYRLAIPGAGPTGKPALVAEDVKSFEFAPDDPERILLTWSRRDDAVDLGVSVGGKLIAVDRSALRDSARFIGPDARRVAYVVTDSKRAGLYVADLGM